jgi:hypothetical protein
MPADARTQWQRLVDADPIKIRDPLAELLGMVSEGEPLVVTFADAAKHAGHACPAVAGAYRSTQLALEELYPDAYPVRSDIAVVVESDPKAMGVGPMASVIGHITGAARETGFTGFGGYGGRKNLLSFEEPSGLGRAFTFTRMETDETVRVSFTPGTVGVAPPGGGDSTADLIPRLIAGEASDKERSAFYDGWHGRVQRVLDATPGPDSPFTVETSIE